MLYILGAGGSQICSHWNVASLEYCRPVPVCHTQLQDKDGPIVMPGDWATFSNARAELSLWELGWEKEVTEKSTIEKRNHREFGQTNWL